METLGKLEQILKNPFPFSFDSVFDIPEDLKLCILSRKNYLRCFFQVPKTYEKNTKFIGTLCERKNENMFKEVGYVRSYNSYILTNKDRDSEEQILSTNKLKYIRRINKIVLDSILINPKTVTFHKLENVDDELDFCIICNFDNLLKGDEISKIQIGNFNFYGVLYKRNKKSKEFEEAGYLLESTTYFVSKIPNYTFTKEKINIFDKL